MSWYTNIQFTKQRYGGNAGKIVHMSTADQALHNSIDDVQQRARFRAHRLRLDVVNGYTSSAITGDKFDEPLCSATHTPGQSDRITRRWLYDAGAARNCIGRKYVTQDEWKSEIKLPKQMTSLVPMVPPLHTQRSCARSLNSAYDDV